ncbi:uncharacterized protein PHALS_03618 [Plasmopara halstedii]|uniref:ODAD1 central coiled coil region domain-containing protein n=1 Tax=Plasmopara halstedii TaxID=4781 RepID=A0A0P1AYX1_PLAHL|nr:uncharacterized protein PHALS_03618 [Plasmopara halstedii]CEG46949.1 hypothetical protein PHALS_03618 [Plasmopara halstedii]|eukprot:XP_024583318.1 hypothetical protein PHALS_03618 [Plasmopara halstedii]
MQSTGSNIGADLTQLQREYRNMELNRKVYAEETHQVMRRQQMVIEKLRKDNEDMKAELSLAERHLNEGAIAQQQEQVNRLRDQLDNYNRKNICEAKRLETLTQQIQIMRHKVLHQKKHMGGVNAAKENQQMVHKQIRILENRLDKSLMKFNETLAQNKVLREEIDNLRRERVVFDTIYRKLEREHGEKKRQMAQTIESSNQVYEQRDAAQIELRSLQDESRAELDIHRRALSELTKKLEKSKVHASGSAKHRRGFLNGESAGIVAFEDEIETKQKKQKGTWGMAKEEVHVQVSIERVQNFEDAFLKIRAATQINDLDQLVTSFIKKEDQNFSLFNYVNEQNNEIEKLEEWNELLRDEERGLSGNTDSATEIREGKNIRQHKQVLCDLETRLAHTEQAAEKCEARCAEAQQRVDAIKGAIHHLFTKIECNTHLMVELVGDSNVTDANLMTYLGVIEQKTNEILQQYAALVAIDVQSNKVQSDILDQAASVAVGAAGGTNGAVAKLHSILGVRPIAPMGQEPLQINPPNLNDYSSDEGDTDDGMHPFTRDELKARTLKGMRRTNHANVMQSGTTSSTNNHTKRGVASMACVDHSKSRK